MKCSNHHVFYKRWGNQNQQRTRNLMNQTELCNQPGNVSSIVSFQKVIFFEFFFIVFGFFFLSPPSPPYQGKPWVLIRGRDLLEIGTYSDMSVNSKMYRKFELVMQYFIFHLVVDPSFEHCIRHSCKCIPLTISYRLYLGFYHLHLGYWDEFRIKNSRWNPGGF